MLEGDEIYCSVSFDFRAMNNEIQYEAIITGIKLLLALGAQSIVVKSDSQFVVR